MTRKQALKRAPFTENTPLHLAAAGEIVNEQDLERLLNGIYRGSERISAADWQIQNRLCGTPIMNAASHNLLPVVFKPERWAGHAEEMTQLWSTLHPRYHLQVDFKAVQAEVRKLTVEAPPKNGNHWRQRLDTAMACVPGLDRIISRLKRRDDKQTVHEL